MESDVPSIVELLPPCPEASATNARVPPLLREEARVMQERWTGGRETCPMYVTQIWNMWNEDERLLEGYEGPHLLSLVVEQDKEVLAVNEAIRQWYLRCSREEINSTTCGGPITMRGVVGSYASETSLAWIKWSVLLMLNGGRHRPLYRVLDHIGSGTNAQVFSLGLRTVEEDKKILALLHTAGGHLSTRHREQLRVMRSHEAALVAMKEAIGPSSSPSCSALVREYAIMNEVNSILLPLGIRACPVAYAVKDWSEESYEGPCYTGLYVGDTKDHYIRAATIEASCVDTGHCKTSLFMQYIEGQTLRESSVSTEELNVVLCYVHSVANILWSKGGIVHNDIHGGNIILEGYGMDRNYVLPICNGEGEVLHWVTLPFRPVLIDWGMGCSAKINGYSVTCSPLRSPLCDILALYSRLLVGEYKTPGFIHCKKVASPYVRELVRDVAVPILTPPYGLTLPDLDHSELLQAYLEYGAHEAFLTTTEDQASPSLHWAPALDEVEERESLVREARVLLASYYDTTTLREGDDPRGNIRRYLLQTAEFYSS